MLSPYLAASEDDKDKAGGANVIYYIRMNSVKSLQIDYKYYIWGNVYFLWIFSSNLAQKTHTGIILDNLSFVILKFLISCQKYYIIS